MTTLRVALLASLVLAGCESKKKATPAPAPTAAPTPEATPTPAPETPSAATGSDTAGATTGSDTASVGSGSDAGSNAPRQLTPEELQRAKAVFKEARDQTQRLRDAKSGEPTKAKTK